jgi:hypothetical protein
VPGKYEPVTELRSGPGENGDGVTLDDNEKTIAQSLINEFGFNMVASDKIFNLESNWRMEIQYCN